MIHYRKRKKYKYTLEEEFSIQTGIHVDERVVHEHLTLSPSGVLTIAKGYSWDGLSWSPDFKYLMSSSLVHDAIYQLIREGSIDKSFKRSADVLFANLGVENGSPKLLAGFLYLMLKLFGSCGIKSLNKTAP